MTQSQQFTPRRRVVILTALPVEHAAVAAHLTAVTEEVHQTGTIYSRGESSDGGWDVLLAEIGAGNENAGVHVERALSSFKPDVLLFVGVAGGLKDVAIGDVVAATKVYGYESGKEDATFRPRPVVANASHRMEQRARAEARSGVWVGKISDSKGNPRAFVGPIAAGAKVVANSASPTAELLRASYGDALAVEMEGYGALAAAHAYPTVEAIVIRGISDLLDEKHRADASGSQEAAAAHAAAFAFAILERLPGNSPTQDETNTTNEAQEPSGSMPGGLATDPEDGNYATALLTTCADVVIPGTSIAGPAAEIYVEPTLRVISISPDASPEMAFYEQELHEREGPRVGFEFFRETAKSIVVAPAGFGKTELTRALAREYIRGGYLPALVSLAELIEKQTPILSLLETSTNQIFATHVAWKAHAESGRAVLLLDGLDELAQHPRALAIKRVREFSARFPNVRWVLTVRDQNALAGVPEATVVALEPWHDEQRVKLATAFLGQANRALALELCERVKRHAELDRLARVPLFLALLAEEFRGTARTDLPIRRGPLLLRYTERLFHAEYDADKKPLKNQPRALLAAAERLAFWGLSQDATDLNPTAATTELSLKFGSDAEALLLDLSSCGLLRTRYSHLRFAFPLVQEYLAGRFIRRTKSSTEIAALFGAAATKPWAQATRFALEESPDADAIATSLLQGSDDAFSSILRALGQCVADGANVAPTTRAILGERLAKLWATSEFGQHAALTNILAEGFSAPLPDSARQAIVAGRSLQEGAGALLSAAKDDGLTRKILQRDLLPFAYTLNEAKPALSRIADEVVVRCISWLRAQTSRPHPYHDGGWVACIIRDLDGVGEPLRRQLVDDTTLPASVRTGALLLRPGELSDRDAPLVLAALREVFADAHPARTYYFELIEQALWRLPATASAAIWIQLVTDTQIAVGWRLQLLAGVGRYRPALEALDLLDRITLPPELRVRAQHLQAWLGRRDLLESLTANIATQDISGLRSWAALMGRYLDKDLTEAGLRRLATRAVTAENCHELVHALWMPFVYHTEGADPITAATTGRYRRRHPAADAAAALFVEWAQRVGPRDGAAILCFAFAMDLGSQAVREPLLKAVSAIHSGALSWKEDYAVSHAVRHIARTGALPLELFKQLAKRSSSNAAFAIYETCARHPSETTLTFLLEEHERVAQQTKAYVRRALSAVATALAVKIVESDGRLVRDSTSNESPTSQAAP